MYQATSDTQPVPYYVCPILRKMSIGLAWFSFSSHLGAFSKFIKLNFIIDVFNGFASEGFKC
ncbi:hypothetical protein EAY27_29420, partial [Vibrio anguillarum]